MARVVEGDRASTSRSESRVQIARRPRPLNKARAAVAQHGGSCTGKYVNAAEAYEVGSGSGASLDSPLGDG